MDNGVEADQLTIDIAIQPAYPVEYVTIPFSVTHANGDPLTAEEMEDLLKAFNEAIEESASENDEGLPPNP